ncbi:MAG: hypothetical protein M1294_07180 [Firmicutes bacterium]|jgi:hypothetical protein|uniref:Glycosyltransferase RgtA/B/C/D-like domain-containing protein n=1 Tax=Sulfobacillus benefaciens TaxID=453960 RepID=A0A2T2X3N2_9FIRM|nr:hypothetical protein [Bacillota bacterium]MCL5015928.1 hypothetical protein [Bacillota bacterium]PSR29089.1 MAG: hypothetical protein C7B43_08750 [Sulfobacillus benefaciens]
MAKDPVSDAAVAVGRKAPLLHLSPHLKWSAIRPLLWLFLISRAFFMEIGGLAYIYLPHAWVESPPGTLPPGGQLLYHVTFGLWSHWDGLWYLSIANRGYLNHPTATAFFPLYPWLIRLFGGGVISGVFLSLLCFGLTLWFLFHLTRLEFGSGVAWDAVLVLAFFPTAFYANAVYSEPLFMALAIGALYFARTRQYMVAGPMAMAATLASMYGILLSVPLLLLIWRQEHHRLRPLLNVLWPPLGLAVYMTFLLIRFGDPLVFEHAQSNWARHFDWFGSTFWAATLEAWKARGQAINLHQIFAHGMPQLGPSNFYNWLFAIFLIAVLVFSIRRLPLYLWVYEFLAIMVPFSYPATGYALMSLPRLVMEAFPAFIALGLAIHQNPGRRLTYFVLALPLGVLFVSLFATAHWVA